MKKEALKTSNIPITFVPLSEIVVKDNLNPRLSLPDIEGLKESLKQNGIQENLKVYFDEELQKYVVVKGHRRIQASRELAIESDISFSEILIPCSKYKVEPDAETILRDHVISNSGFPFTAIEKAEIIERYKLLGFKLTEIATKMSMTYQQAWNLEHLHNAPPEIKQMVQDGLISSTLVVEEFKKTKDFDAMLETFKLILLSGAAKITSSKIKELEDNHEQEEEENEEDLKNSFQSSAEAPKPIKMDVRISLLVEELKLQYDDRNPERNALIDRDIAIFSELQSGTETSIIVNSFYDIQMNKPKFSISKKKVEDAHSDEQPNYNIPDFDPTEE